MAEAGAFQSEDVEEDHYSIPMRKNVIYENNIGEEKDSFHLRENVSYVKTTTRTQQRSRAIVVDADGPQTVSASSTSQKKPMGKFLICACRLLLVLLVPLAALAMATWSTIISERFQKETTGT